MRILLILALACPVMARETSPFPASNQADVQCLGPVGYEVCLDFFGNWIPTTDNVGNLGSSALRWANVYGVNLVGNWNGGTVANQTTFQSTVTVQGNAFSVGGSTLVVSAGNVSIGPVPTPYTQLSISGSSSTSITDAGSSRFVGQLDIVSTASYTTQGGGCVTLGGNATSAGSTDTFVSLCGQKTSASSANDGGGLRVKVGQNVSGNMSDAFTILNTGNVGIGTTSPTGALSVYGVITSSTPLPTISCNTGSAVLSSDSTSMAGAFTVTGAATNCTVSFATGYHFTKAPHCFCNNESVVEVLIAQPTTGSVLCVDASISLSGNVIDYGCWGAP